MGRVTRGWNGLKKGPKGFHFLHSRRSLKNSWSSGRGWDTTEDCRCLTEIRGVPGSFAKKPSPLRFEAHSHDEYAPGFAPKKCFRSWERIRRDPRDDSLQPWKPSFWSLDGRAGVCGDCNQWQRPCEDRLGCELQSNSPRNCSEPLRRCDHAAQAIEKLKNLTSGNLNQSLQKKLNSQETQKYEK